MNGKVVSELMEVLKGKRQALEVLRDRLKNCKDDAIEVRKLWRLHDEAVREVAKVERKIRKEQEEAA